MADEADDRGLLVKSMSGEGSVTMPSRTGDALHRFADSTFPSKLNEGSRCLSVGRGITLSGEVTSCDKLLIEGSVEATLTNCRIIEIAESGVFKGSTTIEEAEVCGRFEGDLVVHNRLLIKATGRVSGTIRYGQIEIERGGQILGNIQAQSSSEAGDSHLN
jgi:cytoskeletal protein CcmA (bactofilin family)